MATIVFDIETVGEDFDSLDDTSKKSLTRWIREDVLAESEYAAALQDVKNGLGFSPLTGEVVALGLFDVERGKRAVYFQSPSAPMDSFEEDGISFKPASELKMLEEFWRIAESYDTFVTFNGRGFDVPFLMMRSAIHRIRPSRDLLSNRYLSSQRGAKHIDLLDQMSFYGAVRRRPSLHLACRAFGIPTPKGGGIDGDQVAEFFRSGRCLDVARYNVRDIEATAALYEYWQKYLRF